jgi:hypothetical protein
MSLPSTSFSSDVSSATFFFPYDFRSFLPLDTLLDLFLRVDPRTLVLSNLGFRASVILAVFCAPNTLITSYKAICIFSFAKLLRIFFISTKKAKAVPRHTMKALAGRGVIAPIHL